jgi:hypothetical protein
LRFDYIEARLSIFVLSRFRNAEPESTSAANALAVEMFFFELRRFRWLEFPSTGGTKSRNICLKARLDRRDDWNVGAAKSESVAHAVRAFVRRSLREGGSGQ